MRGRAWRGHKRWLRGLVLVAILAVARPATATEETLSLDPQATEVRFALDTPLVTVKGHLYLQSGEVRFDLATGSASGTLRFDARRAVTGSATRDRRMHEQVLESDRYPWIELVPTHVEGWLPARGHGEIQLRGDCRLHGDTHPMVLTVGIDVDDGRLTARSAFEVPYVAWGLADPSLLILRVDKVVEVSVVATGALSSALMPAPAAVAMKNDPARP